MEIDPRLLPQIALQDEPLRCRTPPVRLEREDEDGRVDSFVVLTPHRNVVEPAIHIAIHREPDDRDVWLAFDCLERALVCELVNGAVEDNRRTRFAGPLLEGVDPTRHDRSRKALLGIGVSCLFLNRLNPLVGFFFESTKSGIHRFLHNVDELCSIDLKFSVCPFTAATKTSHFQRAILCLSRRKERTRLLKASRTLQKPNTVLLER